MKKLLALLLVICAITAHAQTKNEKFYVETNELKYEGKPVYSDDKGRYIWKQVVDTSSASRVETKQKLKKLYSPSDLRLRQAQNCFITGGSFMITGTLISIIGSEIDPPTTSLSSLNDYIRTQKSLNHVSNGSFLMSGVFFILGGTKLYKSKDQKMVIKTCGNQVSLCYNF